MKRLIAFLMAVICAFGIMACGTKTKTEKAEAEVESVEGADSYKIGVIVYSNTDEEVVSFRNYLEGYIAEVFPAITFLYSDSITTEEEELEFIQKACDEGADGMLSFLTMDLKKEVDLCAQNKVYYMLASGSVSPEEFRKVAENPYFIGAVGPGSELEYRTGSDMAAFFADQKFGDQYFILSGGAGIGNEMHLQRTIGILDKLQEKYGVTFEQSSREIALSTEPVHATAGELSVCVTPGYIAREEFLEPAIAEYGKDAYQVVLSVLPIAGMADIVKDCHLGLVDCYTDTNLQLFNKGELSYLAGKYSSIVGPSFAAMYNAVTGYAEDFREDGKAFSLTQGFWYSDSPEDYAEKYALANSVVSNAYNYEDLGKVCKVYNPDATLEDLKVLISAYSYEDAKNRRESQE
ncbi:MAG: hypothetical protein IKX76_00120 [Eubacterium sp.]|nr:hypothetical protein [Eubacterium sp.]